MINFSMKLSNFVTYKSFSLQILGGIFDNSRFCGRQFALTTGVAADVGSVCSKLSCLSQ